MSKAEIKNFKSPDEVRTFEKGKLEFVNLGEGTIGRFTLEPGWRWSIHVKPESETALCEAQHFSYQISGHLHVAMKDGTEFETKTGDVFLLPPGHDAWVVGNEPVLLIDWSGAEDYIKE